MDHDSPTAEPVIRIRGLRKAFKGHLGIGRTVALAGLDLDVARGEVFGLLGPNGAGKTTTLKLMLGLLRSDAGEVRLFDSPPSDPAARARIGYLPENPYFYDSRSSSISMDGCKGSPRPSAAAGRGRHCAGWDWPVGSGPRCENSPRA
jgi:ABC-type transport system involved in Fe-S cluster assembly fused permease/ATPase subunit